MSGISGIILRTEHKKLPRWLRKNATGVEYAYVITAWKSDEIISDGIRRKIFHDSSYRANQPNYLHSSELPIIEAILAHEVNRDGDFRSSLRDIKRLIKWLNKTGAKHTLNFCDYENEEEKN